MDLNLNGLAPFAAPPAAIPVAAPIGATPATLPVSQPAPVTNADQQATDLEAEENAIIEKIDGIVGNQVRFRVDLDTDRAVLQITDPETGEVVNSIPSEEMLAVMERLEEARCHLIDCAV